jgi:hypothetical protein
LFFEGDMPKRKSGKIWANEAERKANGRRKELAKLNPLYTTKRDMRYTPGPQPYGKNVQVPAEHISTFNTILRQHGVVDMNRKIVFVNTNTLTSSQEKDAIQRYLVFATKQIREVMELPPSVSVEFCEEADRGTWLLEYPKNLTKGPVHSDIYGRLKIENRIWSFSHAFECNNSGVALTDQCVYNEATAKVQLLTKTMLIFPAHLYHWAYKAKGSKRSIIACHFRLVAL